jgi:hypothetical protein
MGRILCAFSAHLGYYAPEVLPMTTIKAAVSFFATTAVLALGSAPVAAHHSFAAEYDAAKPVTIHGSVVRVEWTNPHARFYVEAKDTDGSIITWNLELASPNVLVRQGWTRTSLKIGDEITVTGSLAKDGSKMANARNVTLASGKRIFAGSPAGDPGAAPEAK